jgi:hypothetical protein
LPTRVCLACRQGGGGNTLADVLLLALAVPEMSAEYHAEAAARQLQQQALAILASLLEIKSFQPLQYLLGGLGGTRVEPPLAQRLFLLAEHLEGIWHGGLSPAYSMVHVNEAELSCTDRNLDLKQIWSIW